MAFKGSMWKLLACLLVIATVNAQTGSITIQSPSSTADVGTWTDYYFVTATETPLANTDLSMSPSEGLQLSASTLTLTPNAQAQSFRAYATSVGRFNVTFTKSGDANQFSEVVTLYITFKLRSISFEKVPTSVYVGQPSEPVQIWVSSPPVSDLSISLTGDATFQYSPSTVVIKAGSRSAAFVYTALVEAITDLVTVTVSGNEAAWYPTGEQLTGDYTRNVVYRPFTVVSTSLPVFVSAKGYNGISVYTRQAANSSMTVTPQAADTQFTPSSITFSPNQQEAFFTFNTSSPEASKTVYFYTSGEGAQSYDTIAPVTINVPKRTIKVTLSSTYVITNMTYMSIAIAAPVANKLTVSFTAGNVKFNVSSVTFSGNTTSFTVGLRANYLGPDTIYFTLSDNDASYYVPIDAVSINSIIRGNFVGPDAWYIPFLWVGAESDKIPIRASVSPVSSAGITLTPVAANLMFSPPSLTFKAGEEQQYFTITPLYTNSPDATYTTTVNWFAQGPDHTIFDLPPAFTVTVSPRFVQVKWSAHLNTDDSTTSYRYLHKTYKVWASVNYIGDKDAVSVTPVSPYFKFDPVVLHFDAKHTRIEFEATVTGVAPGSLARIDYIIGNKDGGLYFPISTNNVITAIRPLDIVAAVVSPDERAQHGVYLTTNATYGYTFSPASVLSSYHVYSFLIRSFVLPDKSLTITPHSPHVSFSPSKITIHPKDGVTRIDSTTTTPYTIPEGIVRWNFKLAGVYLEANFSVEAKAAGTHMVWFELSGDDADYYDRPGPYAMTFNLVMRPDSESSYKASSSSFLFPSFVVVVLAAFALVM